MSTIVTVTVTEPPTATPWQRPVVWTCFVLFMIHIHDLWFWVLAVAVSVAVVWLVVRWGEVRWERMRAELRRRTDLADRADQQHAWVLAGDPRGTYGHRLEGVTR